MVLIAEAQQVKAKLQLKGRWRPDKMVRNSYIYGKLYRKNRSVWSFFDVTSSVRKQP